MKLERAREEYSWLLRKRRNDITEVAVDLAATELVRTGQDPISLSERSRGRKRSLPGSTFITAAKFLKVLEEKEEEQRNKDKRRNEKEQQQTLVRDTLIRIGIMSRLISNPIPNVNIQHLNAFAEQFNLVEQMKKKKGREEKLAFVKEYIQYNKV